MAAPWMFRSLSVALLAACAGLTALSGCGGSAPPKDNKKDEKKEEPKPVPKANPNPGTTPDPQPQPPQSTLGEVEPAADQAATAFLRDLVQGQPKADALSAAFVKVIGKPVQFESDKAKGYSADAAVDWLRRAGDGVAFNPALHRKQAGDVVYVRGSISGARLGKDPNKTGAYSLRLVREGGAWKADWLSLSSVEAAAVPGAPTPEAAAQQFAVVAFVETVADLNGMPKEERAPLIAAAVTPALRASWAPPFDQDKAQGYDYSPGKIVLEVTKIGGGTSSFTVARAGDTPEFSAVLTKPAGKKAYTVKLVRGTGPHEWLVSEVVEAK
jgi:hypothetical protein